MLNNQINDNLEVLQGKLHLAEKLCIDKVDRRRVPYRSVQWTGMLQSHLLPRKWLNMWVITCSIIMSQLCICISLQLNKCMRNVAVKAKDVLTLQDNIPNLLEYLMLLNYVFSILYDSIYSLHNIIFCSISKVAPLQDGSSTQMFSNSVSPTEKDEDTFTPPGLQ